MFLQTVSETIEAIPAATPPTIMDKWLSPDEWGLGNTLAFISLVITLVALFITVYPLISQWIKQKRLEKEVDTQAYPPDVIKNSTKYYIRSDCSSVDPAQEAEMRNVIATNEDLFKFIDKFLSSVNEIRHLLVLADSGMGKSSFVLNYFSRNQSKFFWSKNRRRIAIVYLGSSQAISQIRAIDKKNQTDLILDAFDEDDEAIKDYKLRMSELLTECSTFRHVIITSRSQFFPSDEEIPVKTGIIKIEPRPGGKSGAYELFKVYLSPLTDKQVNQFLRKRYKIWNYINRKKAKALVDRIPLLSIRPMILANIPYLINHKEKIVTSFQLYRILIEGWIERESHWVDNKQLKLFSEKLAVNLYVWKPIRGSEKISKDEVIEIARSNGINLEEWKLTGRSLLNRDAVGNYKFAHRSFLEYLFVESIINGNKPLSVEIKWTEEMKKFFLEYVDELYYTNYDNPDLIPEIPFEGIDLSNSYSPSLIRLMTIGKFASHHNRERIIIKYTDVHSEPDIPNSFGINLSGLDFLGLKFEYLSIVRSNLSSVNLGECLISTSKFQKSSFKSALLLKSVIKDSILFGAIFNEAFLQDATFINCDLRNAHFTEARFANTLFSNCNLEDADFRYTDLHDTLFENCKIVGADFKRANLSKVKGLTTSQLKATVMDGHTVTPRVLEK